MAQDTGGPAFPRDHASDGHNGMTLRDYFAAKAMQGIVSMFHRGIRPGDISLMCADVYNIADAMIAERNK